MALIRGVQPLVSVARARPRAGPRRDAQHGRAAEPSAIAGKRAMGMPKNMATMSIAYVPIEHLAGCVA